MAGARASSRRPRIWLLLRAEFLAIALVLVYVGAVMVLFLFVVMMLDVNFDNLRTQFRSYIPVGATVGVLVLVEMALVLLGSKPVGAAVSRLRAPPAAATRRRWARSSTSITSIRSRSPRWCCWWRSSPPSRSPIGKRRETKYQDPSAQVKVRPAGPVCASSVDEVREE